MYNQIRSRFGFKQASQTGTSNKITHTKTSRAYMYLQAYGECDVLIGEIGDWFDWIGWDGSSYM